MTILHSSWIKALLTISTLCSLLSLASQASAQTNTLETQLRWYHVDMIIFGQDSQYPDPEGTPKVTIHKRDHRAIRLNPPPQQPTSEVLTLLPEEQLQLTKERKALVRSRHHTLLWAGSWYMPLSPQGRATTITIEGGRHIGRSFELEGTIEFALRRFLHVSTNLWINTLNPKLFTQADEVQSSPHRSTSHSPYLTNRPFNTRQKLDLNTLVYIDNPDAGILLKVTRWQPPQPKTPTISGPSHDK